MKHTGENVVRIEAEALRALADRIRGPMASAFERAVELLFCCAGRVVVTGMGKSGLIARKIAATLSSTGTPALYLHPVEALRYGIKARKGLAYRHFRKLIEQDRRLPQVEDVCERARHR